MDMPTPVRYGLDQLAAAGGVSSRTVRYWRTLGVLPPPARSGRVGFYDDRHLQRVRLLSELSRRGIRLDTAAGLIDVIERGSDSIREWLGPGWAGPDGAGPEWAAPGWPGPDEVRPGSGDADRVRFSDDELAARLQGRREVLEGLVRMRLARRADDGNWDAPSSGLLELALRIDRLGIDVETAVGAEAILRRHLRPLAEQLVAWFQDRLPPPESTRSGWARFGALRPIGADGARLILWQELTQAFRRQAQGSPPVLNEPVVPRWLSWIVERRGL